MNAEPAHDPDHGEEPAETPRREILVGVFDERCGAVAASAARYAKAFDADLILAYVEPTTLALGETPQGSLYGGNIPEELIDPEFPDDLLELVEEGLGDHKVAYRTIARRGTPTTELNRIAEDAHALMIVLGTRKPGIRDSMREFLNGSVAAQLSHRQCRPVVVIPLTVVDSDAELPWIGDGES